MTESALVDHVEFYQLRDTDRGYSQVAAPRIMKAIISIPFVWDLASPPFQTWRQRATEAA